LQINPIDIETSCQSKSFIESIKFILDFYFGTIEYDTINTFTDLSTQEFDLHNAVEILKSFHLTTLQRTMDPRDIPAHFYPSILINPKNEILVCCKKINDIMTVFNPSTLELEELDITLLSEYKSALLIFKDPENNSSITSKYTKPWFFEPLKSYWRSYVEIGVLTLFINIFALAIPLFTMSTYDRVVPNKAYETLFVLASGTLLILIFDIILKHSRNHIIENVSKKLGSFWEEELMRKIILTDMHYDHLSTGSKANLFKELQHVRDFFTIRSLMQIIDLPFFFIALSVIYIISPTMAIIPLLISIGIITFNLLMQIPIARLNKNQSHTLQTKNSFIFESIQGTESLKVHNALPHRLFSWRSIVAFSDGVATKIQSLHVFSMNVSQLLVQVVVISVLVVGVFEISKQHLSVGGLIAITILASRAIVPIVNLSGILIRLKDVGESIARINDFFALPSENTHKIEAGLGKLEGKIELKNVSYSFYKSKYLSLENISLCIHAGERVGIIGQTGSGKSTLVKLLLKLIQPSQGSIYIDNHDLSTLHPVEVRQNIGYMPQDPFLFNGSIKDNIDLSKPMSKTKMMEILKLTGLEDLIKKSGQGDGLNVGERGSNLSVGQRHLVALARSLANQAPIIVLDEPTTGLDVGLEKKLIHNLKNTLSKEQTLLVITHRFAALELVDRVIVMNEGKVVADGPKEKILQALQNSTQKGSA